MHFNGRKVNNRKEKSTGGILTGLNQGMASQLDRIMWPSLHLELELKKFMALTHLFKRCKNKKKIIVCKMTCVHGLIQGNRNFLTENVFISYFSRTDDSFEMSSLIITCIIFLFLFFFCL